MWWNQYVGIPFKWRGSARDGCDCWGLVCLVMREQFGADLPALLRRVRKTDVHVNALMEHTRKVELEDLQPGDILHMRGLNHDSAHDLHCGIVLPKGRVLHSEEGAGSCVRRLTGDPMFRNRAIAGYRLVRSGAS